MTPRRNHASRALALLAAIVLAFVMHTHHVCTACAHADSQIGCEESHSHHDCEGLCDIEPEPTNVGLEELRLGMDVDGSDLDDYPRREGPDRNSRPRASKIRPPPRDDRVRARHKRDGRGSVLRC